ncbi:hypothetical protein C0992_012024 [Termitomyces sp. T32_za158]|nr:hypothetical protein C0992_012024 [Termitomyces sp. T32_za158]
MASSRFPSRGVTKENLDSPSEPGLAEWTNKIKAMQRQVDADDEAEQMRLEQEIAASRLARKRRSQGFGTASRTSLDVCKSKLALNPELLFMARVHADQSDSVTSPKSSSEPEGLQTPAALPTRSRTKSSTSSDKPQPMSLAAFMGGSATGPRLRKHAPQQDAHDPTQFDQRVFDRARHPTFGTGGVALPGLAVQRDGPMKPSAIAALAKATLPSPSPEPSLASWENPESSQKETPVMHSIDRRERATSLLPSTSRNSTKTISHKEEKKHESIQLSTPAQDQTARVHSVSPALSKSTTVPPARSSRFSTDDHTPSPSRSLYTAPPLAGPIRPQPRPSVGPQISPYVTPSKAFTRQPVKKELTPSLSRLQGRGFVQSMVKVSSQAESPSMAVTETPEKSTPVSGKRNSSVLDRWQPNVPQTAPSPSPAPRAIRKSTTFDASKDHSPSPTDYERRNLSRVASQPSLRQESVAPRSRSSSKSAGAEKRPAPGLGSATTLVVYKPTAVETPSIDEFGVKPTSRGARLDFPTPSKPLSHPTKERARKPQKRTVSDAPTNPANNPTSSLDVSQVSNEVSVTAVPSVAPTRRESIIPQSRETQPLKVIEHGNQPSKMHTDELRQNLSDLLNSKSVNTSKPGIKPMTYLGDAPRLVRHALPGLSVPQAEGKKSSSKTILSHAQTPVHGLPRQALPELTHSNDKINKVLAADQRLPQNPVLGNKEETLSAKPGNGNKPTVMDVTQSLNEFDDAKHAGQLMETPEPGTTQLRPLALSSKHMERYSSIILPPLKEEMTPTPTSNVTISHKNADLGPHDPSLGQEKAKPISETSGILSLAISQYNSRHHHDPGTTTISVEVMSITGTTASSLTRDQTIFYENELLAIVHRSKSQSSGLVSTSVWGWEGRRAVLGPREQRKLQEIAQRYDTSVVSFRLVLMFEHSDHKIF